MGTSEQKVSITHATLKDKTGYFLANLGPAASSGLASSFKTIYWSDALGINMVALGSLTLISSIITLVATPFIGQFVDNVRGGKKGKYKMPLVLSIFLYAIISAAMWFAPYVFTNGRVTVVLVTSILQTLINAMYDNTVYAILPALSADPHDRVTLGTLRGSVASFAIYGIGFIAPLLIGSDSSDARGYLLAAAVCILLTILGGIGACMVTERVYASEKKEKTNMKDVFAVLKYRPVFVLCLTQMIMSIGTGFVMLTLSYYFTYVFGDLSKYSLFSLMQTLFMLPTLMVLPKFVVKFGRKGMFIFGMLGMVIFPFFKIFDVKSLPLVLITAALYGLAQGAMASNKTGLIADACDYVYIKTRKQNNAAVTAVYTIATNIAMLIATSLPLYILSGIGYVSGLIDQSQSVITGITVLVLVVPLCIYIVAAVFFGKCFPIGKKEVEEQLEVIRKMNEAQE